jgi:anthranilate/para-aminobenzoate synthase component I
VYQVNLTLRAKLETESGAQLLAHLCRRAVPRFAAWVRMNGVELVSASPELLVETQDRWIHVEPMKGTAPPDQRQWLERSEKDRAELAMITDLLRDDLNRLCEPSSVIVRNERRMIELPYVVQTVADVEGTLREGATMKDVLAVVHPGGSVTGAPREAALEDIAKLESTPRGAYCGALGLETNGASRVALLIRTAEKIGNEWRYGVGGGITWDSDPQAELEEVRLKLGALSS